jgi:hypothetical protein
MSLSCECDSDWYPEPGDELYSCGVQEYSEFTLKRRKRCCSCSEFIEIGSLCVEQQRYKVPEDDIEINIYGEDGEIPISSHWMCEQCSDIYFSLEELGFCVWPGLNMNELLLEYKDYVEEKSMLLNK